MVFFSYSCLHFLCIGGDTTAGCLKVVFDRRAVVFSSFGLLAGALLKVADDGVAVASEFADSNFLCFTARSFLLII